MVKRSRHDGEAQRSTSARVRALGQRILNEVRVADPVHPFYVTRAAGVMLCPLPGVPAAYEELHGIMYFDDSLSGWREQMASLACGVHLRANDLPDEPRFRAELTAALGLTADALASAEFRRVEGRIKQRASEHMERLTAESRRAQHGALATISSNSRGEP